MAIRKSVLLTGNAEDENIVCTIWKHIDTLCVQRVATFVNKWMITGIVEVTQDPEKAGSALKVLSLRLRGKQIMPPYKVIYMLCS